MVRQAHHERERFRSKQDRLYLLATRRNGAIGTGVTSNLLQRIQQHATMEHAIVREKRIKKWLGRWKMELIERDNLGRRDLGEDFGFGPLEPTGSPRSAFGSASQPRG